MDLTNDCALGIIMPLNWKEDDPKTRLQELLGDFFIDAEDLEMKELLGEGRPLEEPSLMGRRNSV